MIADIMVQGKVAYTEATLQKNKFTFKITSNAQMFMDI